MRPYLKRYVQLWIRNPSYMWHNLWEPLWKRWVENARYDEYNYTLKIEQSPYNPLDKWQIRLLSMVFNYDYWYDEEIENCPWQNEVKEYGIPYHSRF